MALRQDSWKFIPPGKGAKVNQNTKTEMGTDTSGQLYDLSLDLAERNNLAPTQTQRAQEMAAILKSIQAGDTQQKPEPR